MLISFRSFLVTRVHCFKFQALSWSICGFCGECAAKVVLLENQIWQERTISLDI